MRAPKRRGCKKAGKGVIGWCVWPEETGEGLDRSLGVI